MNEYANYATFLYTYKFRMVGKVRYSFHLLRFAISPTTVGEHSNSFCKPATSVVHHTCIRRVRYVTTACAPCSEGRASSGCRVELHASPRRRYHGEQLYTRATPRRGPYELRQICRGHPLFL